MMRKRSFTTVSYLVTGTIPKLARSVYIRLPYRTLVSTIHAIRPNCISMIDLSDIFPNQGHSVKECSNI